MKTVQQYEAHLDRKSHKYGIRRKGEKTWWLEPQYDAIHTLSFGQHTLEQTWVKRDGKYGYLDIEERKELIPCEYGFPLYFNEMEYAEAWKDYKTGVINLKNEVVIPIIYDELYPRYQSVEIPEEERRLEKRKDGSEQLVGPRFRDVFRGYACFTNEGVRQAYDENMQPCEFEEWESGALRHEYEWEEPENANRSVQQIENRIREEYVKWRKMGGGMPRTHACDIDRSETDDQRQKVINLLYDRRHKMNESWIHDKEHADRIFRTNELLKHAVRKALMLGHKTAKSLEWMNKVTNQDGHDYDLAVYVYPQWTNCKSEYGYKSTLSRSKEIDKLIDEEDNCHNHLWNIIAAMNDIDQVDGVGACFCHKSTSSAAKDWDLKTAEMDDGQTWDELLHFPAYMDCYFLHSFHSLYCDSFFYSLEDIAQMNDLRVRVDVKLETRESNKK